jgi:ATP-binding cassette subfamily B protein
LLNPLSEVIGFSARVKTSVTASERVFNVLDETPAVTDAPDAIDLRLSSKHIVFKNVHFGYAPGANVISGFSARIEPGELVAFVGASGSGKSSLLNLLPRFFDPTVGRIALGHHDLRRLTLSSLRRHIVIVSQDNTLMAGTIAENILYGNPSAGAEKLKNAAELAGATSFIRALPEGFNTQVAEGGKNFSGGQRQRIAIARALATEAPILIFDEPTSALDEKSEALVMETIQNLRGKRTIILVTHRLQTASECDTVYLLENGRLSARQNRRSEARMVVSST